MDQVQLLNKEEEITTHYRAFLDEVRQAFDRHCDEIKTETTRKLEGIPETDQETRQRILDEQKAQLDKTLSELRQLLNTKAVEVRTQLEEIANLRDQQDFNVDAALAEFGSDKQASIVQKTVTQV
jgi:hypothetical protein